MLDPGARPTLVQLGLTRLGERYPALGGLEVAHLGRLDRLRRPTASR